MVGAASAGTGSIYIYSDETQCIFSAHKFICLEGVTSTLHLFSAFTYSYTFSGARTAETCGTCTLCASAVCTLSVYRLVRASW